jgi:hypothetical protein
MEYTKFYAMLMVCTKNVPLNFKVTYLICESSVNYFSLLTGPGIVSETTAVVVAEKKIYQKVAD